MDAEVKAKWIAALRSGEYTQGRQMLKVKTDHGYGYCCLGVLCEIMGVQFTEDGDSSGGLLARYDGDVRISFVPLPLVAKIGLPHSRMYDLAAMNDAIGEYKGNPQTFLQIADWIEQNL